MQFNIFFKAFKNTAMQVYLCVSVQHTGRERNWLQLQEPRKTANLIRHSFDIAVEAWSQRSARHW